MSLIQIILLVLIILAILYFWLRYKTRSIGLRPFLMMLAFWILAGVLVVLPESTSRLAEIFGVGRGVDLVFYFALVLIFYLIFKIFVRLEKIEQNITKIVSKIALKDNGNDYDDDKDVGGICKAAIERSQIKEQNKQKILDLLKSRGKVTNDDVEQLLKVSDAATERYLDELEKENKIKQIGRAGRSVFYELK